MSTTCGFSPSSATTGMTRHLSKTVHGWLRPSRTTSPTASGSSAGRRRKACWSLTAEISASSGRAGGAEARGDDLRFGQALVEGDVAATHVEQGEAGLGPRDHAGPDVHRRPQPRRVGLASRRRDAAVEAVVVNDVRPRADHDPRVVDVAQDGGDAVEVRAAARGDDDPPLRVQREQTVVQVLQRAQVVVDGAECRGRGVVREGALVACDTAEPQPLGRGDAPPDLEGLVDGARTGAAAGATQFDEHGGLPGRIGEPSLERVDGAEPVRPQGDLEGRIGVERLTQPADAGRVGDRVGDVEVPESGGHGGLQLGQVGDGDRRRSGVELLLPERGGHGGLAVGLEVESVRGGPPRELGDVAGHRRPVEHENGRGELRQAGLPGEEVGRCHAVRPRGHRLVEHTQLHRPGTVPVDHHASQSAMLRILQSPLRDACHRR